MLILITSTPEGEAPLWVREAWVGLRLPVVGSGPLRALTSGVLTGPRNRLERLAALFTGKLNRRQGYAVVAAKALAELERHSPDAARWWRENAPNVLQPRRKLLFRGEFCRVVEDAAS